MSSCPRKAGIQYAVMFRNQSQAARSSGSSVGARHRARQRRDPGRMMTKAVELASLLQILLHLVAKTVAQIGARHGEGDVGAEETRLGAAIMPLALELDAVEGLRFRQADHRIGELDLAAGAALLRLQDFEDLRLQDVAPGN